MACLDMETQELNYFIFRTPNTSSCILWMLCKLFVTIVAYVYFILYILRFSYCLQVSVANGKMFPSPMFML